MTLKKYNEFILESILLASDNFKELIYSIDDPIAIKFREFIDKDIKTKYNIIDTTDTNDKLAFLPDSQVEAKLKSTSDINSIFSSLSNKTTIGRVIRGILTDNNIQYKDSEIEKFVNKFKSAWVSKKNEMEKNDPIKIVRGEDIKRWYHYQEYCTKTRDGIGTLGKSCMRYDRCQLYLNIYVMNPEECGMVIYTDSENKLRARALLWKTDKGLKLDRIYYTDDSDSQLVKEWVNKKFTLSDNSSIKSVKLTGKTDNSDGTYEYYPYMDSFMYYDANSKTLWNSEPEVNNRKLLFELQSTTGGAVRMDMIYCEYEDERYPANSVVYSDSLESYIHIDNAIYSEYLSDYIWRNDSVWSIKLDSYIDRHSVIKVYLDVEDRSYDYFLIDDKDKFYDNVVSKHYIIDLMDRDDYGIVATSKNIWTVYKVDDLSIDTYKKIYRILEVPNQEDEIYYATEVDERIFGIKLEKGKSMRIAINTFVSKYYNYLIVKEINKLIEDSDANEKDKSLKNEQIDITCDILDKGRSLFECRNTIYNVGVNQFITLWDNYFRSNILMEFTELINGGSSKFINELGAKDENLKILATELLRDPREFHLAFSQNENECDTEIKSKLLLKIENRLGISASDPKYQFKINDIINSLKKLFSNMAYGLNWTSYQGIIWIKIFDAFLINQKRFRDIV